MDIDFLKEQINQILKKFEVLNNTCKIDEKKTKLEELEKKTYEENFYTSNPEMGRILSKIKSLSFQVKRFKELANKIEDAKFYLQMAEMENDFSSYKESENIINGLNIELEKLEIDALLSDEYDSNNAIVSIHPGAGGTESQDWAEMLYRMYQKWCTKSQYDIELLDMQDGEEAGIKSVSFLVKGNNAYGYLKGESGVHRLVRISPFDSNSRRHTSFTAVEVMPEITDEVTIEIKPEDLQVDTFRASGAGGQHVNKTESAIRIKHIPTGIVVGCQTERSQLQNREYAMKMLRAKLFTYEMQKKQEEKDKLKGETLDIAWGNQIRSYVFCPYTLVKDHRTNYEIGNVQAVMDGKIDEFMYEYLKLITNNKSK